MQMTMLFVEIARKPAKLAGVSSISNYKALRSKMKEAYASNKNEISLNCSPVRKVTVEKSYSLWQKRTLLLYFE